MQFNFPGFSIIYLISAILCFISALMLLRRHINPGSVPFALLMLSLTMWSFMSIFEAGAMTEADKIFWSKWQYIGITTVGPFWLLFTAFYTKREKYFSGILKWAIWIIPVAILLLAFTNESHEWIWTGISINYEQGYIGDYDHGPLFFVHIIYSYGCIFLGTVWMMLDIFKNEKKQRLKPAIFVFMVLIGWAANIIYILDLFPIPGLDITPITFSFISLVMFFMIYRFRVFDLVPIARTALLNSMKEGVIVIDPNDVILEINPAAIEITEYKGKTPTGEKIWDVFANYKDQIISFQNKTNFRSEMTFPENPNKTVEIQVTSIGKEGVDFSGQLIVFRDISKRKQFERTEKEQRIFAEALADSAAAINSSLDLDEVLERILDNVSKVVPHDAANIALITKPGVLKFVKIKNPECYRAFNTMQGSTLEIKDMHTFSKMAATGQPIIINNTQADDDWDKELLDNQWIRSYLGAPIFYKNQLLGFINVDSNEKNFYKQEHVDRMRVFSEYAAIALKNARLYTDTRYHADEMTILYEVSQAIAAGVGLEKTTKAIFQQLKRIIPVDLFFLALVDPSEKIASYFMYRGNEERIEIKPFSIDETPSLTGYVIEKRKTIYIPDFKADNAEVKEDQIIRVPGFDNRTFLGVPLILRGEVIGVLSIQSASPNAYSSNQIRLVETIAQQATIAMDNAKLFERMQELAITDGLTGLYNRRYFYMILENEIERSKRYETPLSLIMIDIDHFKRINDRFGHLAGDEVLALIAQSCKQLLRQTDNMFRYGGEEFMVLLPETSIGEAEKVAERIRSTVDDTEFDTKKGKIKITASVGVSQYTELLSKPNDFIESADNALYRAKQAGRNCVRIYSRDS